MTSYRSRRDRRWAMNMATTALGLVLVACGGSSSTEQDRGTDKTTLTAEASDADGDTLQYQWRVTAGSVENRDARSTVWTLPDGPGLHFAYVIVSDGKGGYVEQQYAVSTDAFKTATPVRALVSHTAPAVTDPTGTTARLRFVSPDSTLFTPPAGGTAVARSVYLPDVQVQVQHSGTTVFSGLTDLSGEVNLPPLQSGETYNINCSTSADAPLASCGSFVASDAGGTRTVPAALTVARNLRLFGHVGLADGGVCGVHNEYFGLQSAATVQLLQDDGTVLSAATRVNRFGNYAIDAAVPVRGSLQLKVQCESSVQTLAVPASSSPSGYISTLPIELSTQTTNNRPRVVKVVANGPEGNVRGRMIVPEVGVVSNDLPGAQRFLAQKGQDTPLSTCMYYRALGAVRDCDAEGRLIEPISFDDWKRQQGFAPYAGSNTEVKAIYINKMDLNLVRHMTATQSGPQKIAFQVCNNPGPEGSSQKEIDDVTASGLAGEKKVACVVMEWSTTPGVNGGLPFTKFLTFAPDGALVTSVNLDGRGEKFLPGACVACHGGTHYNGRFPETGNPSPYLGSGFLPFDTGNFLFSSNAALTESAQSASLYGLNQLVRATHAPGPDAVTRLIDGWYTAGGTTLDKDYVPPAWLAEEATTPGAARFYREVVGASCRTCHVSLDSTFDWDSIVLTPDRARVHVCGGTSNIAANASMPNSLISRDRITQRAQADPALAALMTTFLGCSTPLPDPAYPAQ